MGKVLNFIAGVIAFLLSLLVTLVIPLSMLGYNVARVVFDPPLVERVITEIVVESDLIPVALGWLSERRAAERAEAEQPSPEDEPDIVQLLEFVDSDGWGRIKAEVLPDEILVEWVSVTVDGVYAWIDSDDRIPDITFNMQPFKDRVNSQHGSNSVQIVYDSLSPCEQVEIDDFLSRLDAAPVGKEVPYNLCQFPDPWHDDQFSDYHESLLDVVENVMPKFALSQELAQVETPGGIGPEALKNQLRLTRSLARLAPLAALALLLLILLLTVRSWREFGRWWGLPLLIGGFLVVLIALLYSPIIVTLLAAGPMSEVPPLVRHEAAQAVIRLAKVIFGPMLPQSLVVFAVGLVLTILATVARDRQDDLEEWE